MGQKAAGSGGDGVMWTPRLGGHLEAARRRAGLRRIDLAARLGVSEETIRLWERGAVQPSPDRLARLISILSIEESLWQVDVSSPSDPADELPELARRLRAERAALGLTQAAVAERLGIAQATYAGWETGRTTPGAQHAARIAELLGVTEEAVVELLGTSLRVDTTGWPELGQLMGRRREVLQLSRAALAHELGTTSRTIMAWELGYRRPPTHQLPALARALTVSVDDLVRALPRRSAPSRLGELILARQRALGLQSTDVARLVGTTEPTVSRWINGHCRPTRENLRKLAAVLQMPLSELGGVA